MNKGCFKINIELDKKGSVLLIVAKVSGAVFMAGQSESM